jgi:hypothetical protein
MQRLKKKKTLEKAKIWKMKDTGENRNNRNGAIF